MARKINLGEFYAGEIPYPYEHTFKDGNKAAINLTGWTLLGFYIEGPLTVIRDDTYFSRDDVNGKVTYSFVEADMQEPGNYKALVWIANAPTAPTIRLASDLVVWKVLDGPEATPSG